MGNIGEPKREVETPEPIPETMPEPAPVKEPAPEREPERVGRADDDGWTHIGHTPEGWPVYIRPYPEEAQARG